MTAPPRKDALLQACERALRQGFGMNNTEAAANAHALLPFARRQRAEAEEMLLANLIADRMVGFGPDDSLLPWLRSYLPEAEHD